MMIQVLTRTGGAVFITLGFIFSAFAQETKSLNFAETFIGEKLGRKTFVQPIAPVADKTANKFLPDAPDASGWKLARGAKELNVEIGFAPTQPTFFSGVKEYDTAGRKFALLSLRWGRVVGTAKGVTYQYRAEIIPVALAFKNEVANPAFQTATATPNIAPTVRQTTYGFGFTPAGFRFLFLPNHRLKPYVAADAGFIFFKKPVPIPPSTSYDFIGSFGGGVQYQVKKDKAVSFGYRYFHISNMNIGEVNPGYNANVFYVGYSFFYK